MSSPSERCLWSALWVAGLKMRSDDGEMMVLEQDDGEMMVLEWDDGEMMVLEQQGSCQELRTTEQYAVKNKEGKRKKDKRGNSLIKCNPQRLNNKS